ncbi:hypothetical protein BDN70DRAFT_882098 [Pholiota conissans]|uniref:Uncharacterized protein n=1 Tax=Pholiota conissans TaxID=109636 RepID=A0A9P6CRY3_9AGAR|nr:hypothetical protein BDN70DRAFT_882098 [Pholiota conissans]
MSRNPTPTFEYDTHAGEAPKDGLFLERLDAFMQKCLGDIRAFAERESRPYEETRRCIAQCHAKYLFQSSIDTSALTRSAQVRTTLCDASRILESLSDLSGVQSFLLAIDPNDGSDPGFLGGSLMGREFWRLGMRGGGDSGARAFKAYFATHAHATAKFSHMETMKTDVLSPSPAPLTTASKRAETPAKSLKNELYEMVRSALRTTSGVRNAEMKWTNPEKLDIYGVRLVGWPEGIPAQNPSTMKVSQNKILHEALQNGTMRFERVVPERQDSRLGDDGTREANDDFSWAYDVEAHPPPPSLLSPAPLPDVVFSIPSPKSVVNANTPPPEISEPEENMWTLDPIAEVNTTSSPYNVDYTWGDEFSEVDVAPLGEEWDSELQTQIERPRKRPRSEEPGSG